MKHLLRSFVLALSIVALAAHPLAAQTIYPHPTGAEAFAKYATGVSVIIPASTAPTAGVIVPLWATRAVVSIEGGGARFLYATNPTSANGVMLPEGTIMIFNVFEMPAFREIRIIGLAAGTVITIQYTRGRPA